jgi:hypothetical protein
MSNFENHSETLLAIIQLFNQIGLDADQAKIYLACLPKIYSITEVSRITNFNRSTLHSKLKKMTEIGVVTLLQENNKQLIQTNDLNFVTNKINLLVANAKDQISTSFNQNQIHLFSKIDLILDVYNELLNEIADTDFYYINGNISKWVSLNPSFFKQFVKERDRLIQPKKFKIKAIFDKGGQDFEYESFYRKIKNIDYKIIEDIDYDSNTVITRSKMIIHSIPTNQLIYTSNPFMISAFKLNFEILWNFLR